MQITPLSLIRKSIQSPQKRLDHQDSLIFSITSSKFDQRKQTLLLEQSKQLRKQSSNQMVTDYFKIQDKIKVLEQKVQSIKTQYCQSEQKLNFDDGKQNIHDFSNVEFPKQIYYNRFAVDDNSTGKIKRKKSKYYTGIEQNNKSRSNSINESSTISTKRNQNRTYNVNDFSVNRTNNSFKKQNTTMTSNLNSKRKSSFSTSKDQNYYVKNQELGSLRKQLIKNKLSTEKLSRRSKESQRHLSISKDQIKKIKTQSKKLQIEVNNLKLKLKKSENIKEKQKNTILKQKQQINELKRALEQLIPQNVSSLINLQHKDQKAKIKMIR